MPCPTPLEADAVQRLLRTTLESVETRRRDTFRKLPRDTQDLDALIVDPFWPQAIEPLLAVIQTMSVCDADLVHTSHISDEDDLQILVIG